MLHDNTGGQAGRGSGRGSKRGRKVRGQAGGGVSAAPREFHNIPEHSSTLQNTPAQQQQQQLPLAISAHTSDNNSAPEHTTPNWSRTYNPKLVQKIHNHPTSNIL